MKPYARKKTGNVLGIFASDSRCDGRGALLCPNVDHSVLSRNPTYEHSGTTWSGSFSFLSVSSRVKEA